MITKTDLSYAAGYIDGDGCFHINQAFVKNRISPKYRATIIISSVNKDVLVWFKEMFGGTINSIKRIQYIKNHKLTYNFSIPKNIAIPFIHQIQPYLVEKLEESRTFINFTNSKDRYEHQSYINEMDNLKNLTNLVTKDMKPSFELQRNTISPTQEDFAYLAGFIDAECCLGIQKYRSKNKPNYLYKILLQCNNTKAPFFKWALERFGGQIHFIDRNTKDPNQRNQLTWRLSSYSLAKILNNIYPFLKHKKPVCEELIKFYNTKPILGSRNSETHKIMYSEVIKIREEIVNKIHILNSKGKKIT